MAPEMEAAAYWNLLPLAMLAIILITIRLRQENVQRLLTDSAAGHTNSKGKPMDSRNFTYMFYGFAAAWVILVIYVISLVARERRSTEEMSRLKKLMEEGSRK